MHHVCKYIIYIWSPPPPGPIRALGAGVIILDNYIINMITCSKIPQIPVKNASWMHMTLNIVTFQKGKNTNFLKTESVFWKGSNLSSNCKPFAWKIPSKSCMGSKKCNMRQGYLQAIETISKYKWRNALGFELQSAPNLHRDKKNQSVELQSAPNLHRDKKNKSFELQSAPNLHRDKKNKKKQKL